MTCWPSGEPKIRQQVEEIFGWMKTVGGLRRSRYRGVERTGLAGYLVSTAYNLVRMANPLTREEARGRPVGVTCLGKGAPNWGGRASPRPTNHPTPLGAKPKFTFTGTKTILPAAY